MKKQTYKGKFVIKNKSKYKGDWTNVVYRSSWERQFFRWADSNPDVVWWNSEELFIPYVCKTDNKIHRYFPDIMMKLKNGKTYMIEIKPKCQTVPPKGKRKTAKLLNETLTYMKNESKWEAATAYCQERGYEFKVFTEDTLRSLGIMVI